MDLTHLVQNESNKGFSWSDTGKSARITRNIGEPRTIDLSTVNPSWLENPIGVAVTRKPYRHGLPKKTEVSFYVLEQDVEANHPYMKVQYVEAKR